MLLTLFSKFFFPVYMFLPIMQLIFYSSLIYAAQTILATPISKITRPYIFITKSHHFPQAKNIPIRLNRAQLNNLLFIFRLTIVGENKNTTLFGFLDLLVT